MDKVTGLREEGLLSKCSFNYRTPGTAAFVFIYILLPISPTKMDPGPGHRRQEGGRDREGEEKEERHACDTLVVWLSQVFHMRPRVLQSHSMQLRQGERTWMVLSEHRGSNSRESRLSG